MTAVVVLAFYALAAIRADVRRMMCDRTRQSGRNPFGFSLVVLRQTRGE